MTLVELAKIHNSVAHKQLAHSEFCQNYDNAHPNARKPRYFPDHCLVCKEEIWIKKYPYDTLNSVCSDCFSSVDAEGDTGLPEHD